MRILATNRKGGGLTLWPLRVHRLLEFEERPARSEEILGQSYLRSSKYFGQSSPSPLQQVHLPMHSGFCGSGRDRGAEVAIAELYAPAYDRLLKCLQFCGRNSSARKAVRA